ncbi:hypothetical protein [Pseudomonas agarici]|uniref:hypothetical protein n=1 Tax=Pseudomonas agarici TaxID=46677 RepID=UPI0015A45AE5|nr:hypothetical protein [Pseudomonas agarici]NWB91590.1 hypothetical protein [Pseudomonas agarici]
MANFKSSFDQGLKAAASAAAVHAEIDSVFSEMNTQISEASDGKINIFRETRYDHGFNSLIGMGIFSGATNKQSAKIEKTTYIVARNPLAQGSNKGDLGTVHTHKDGYPCEIKIGDDRYICEDKPALEKILSVMLSDTDVGKTLRKLINLPSSDEETVPPE